MRHKRGFAILTAIFVMVALAVLGVGAVALISGSGQQMKDEYQSERAFQVALGGRAYIAAQLKGDTDWSDNADVVNKSLSPGTFTVHYLAKTANTATVEITGTVGGITRKIQQVFQYGTVKAWQHGIYTQQQVSSSGSSTGDVYGPISAGGTIATSGGVVYHDATDPNNTNAQVPTPNWAYWQGIAAYVGNNPFPAGGLYPASGTAVYYDTNAGDIPSNTTINGTVVIRGGLNSNAKDNVTITPAPGFPAMIIDGNLRINGGANWHINGWVIVIGTIDLIGTSGFNGTGGLSATGDISFSGNTSIQLTYDPTKAPSGAGNGFSGGELGGSGEGKFIGYGQWKETF